MEPKTAGKHYHLYDTQPKHPNSIFKPRGP